MRSVWERYGAEMLITETSHVDERRPVWLRELSLEAESMLAERLPLRGVCLYPILGMPEWHKQDEWTQMGLGELKPNGGGDFSRIAYEPMMKALREARRIERKKGDQ